MRDRLKELIRQKSCFDVNCDGDCFNCTDKYSVLEIDVERIADHLLANGVIVPPVSVGQTVWVYNQTTNNIYRNTVIGIKIFGTGKNANKIIVKYVNQRGETSDRKFAWSQIGKQVFLSEEDAVQALAERSGE